MLRDIFENILRNKTKNDSSFTPLINENSKSRLSPFEVIFLNYINNKNTTQINPCYWKERGVLVDKAIEKFLKLKLVGTRLDIKQNLTNWNHTAYVL